MFCFCHLFIISLPKIVPRNVLLCSLVRSVEARVARRNSLANVPHLLESDSDSPSGLMLARRSLSDRFKLQVIIKADVSYIVHPIIYPFRRREGWGSAQCQTWQIISAAQLSLLLRGDYLARLVQHLVKLNTPNTFSSAAQETGV